MQAHNFACWRFRLSDVLQNTFIKTQYFELVFWPSYHFDRIHLWAILKIISRLKNIALEKVLHFIFGEPKEKIQQKLSSLLKVNSSYSLYLQIKLNSLAVEI